jgi:hypothetical protein
VPSARSAALAQNAGNADTLGGITAGATPLFLAPSGLSAVSPNASTVSELASAESGTATDLTVFLSSAPLDPVTFTLDVGGSPTAVTCTVPIGSFSCTASGSAPVADADVVTLQFASAVGTGIGRIQFGWLESF